MSVRLTESDVVDAFVDAVRVAWPVPIQGLPIVIVTFAKKLGIESNKLEDMIVRRARDDREMRRSEEA